MLYAEKRIQGASTACKKFRFFLEPLAILQKFVYNNRWNDSSALISAVIQWNNSSDKRFFPAYLERKMRAVQDER